MDCHGTLIDFEGGRIGHLQPLLEARDGHAVDGFLLGLFGRTDAALRAGSYPTYRAVQRRYGSQNRSR